MSAAVLVRGVESPQPDMHFRTLGDLGRWIYQHRGEGGVVVQDGYISREETPNGPCAHVYTLKANGQRGPALGYVFIRPAEMAGISTPANRLKGVLLAIAHKP